MNNEKCNWLIDYFNGELSIKEKEEFEEHLKDCLECQQELAELNTLHEDLPFASEPVNPPEGMKDRVLGNIFANDETNSSNESETVEGTEENETERKVPSIYKNDSKRKIQKKQASFYTIAAILFLSLVGNIYLLMEMNDIADTPVEESENQTDQLIQSVSLDATEVMDATGQASILENEEGRTLLVQADNLEEVSGEEAYQVWLLEDEQPYRAGTFVPSESGSGAVSFNLDNLEDVNWDTVAITLEPTPNSEVPQGDILLAAGL
ncbi:anti-sigma factor domain-containing protein [Alkalibacillus sp. S2W]|uniref:anti-sigma factor n=1 Tax=Alkalibacillus sp. S2W TaxID=3386553 RepID=UPI00398CDF72